jgi:hypothetical protein
MAGRERPAQDRGNVTMTFVASVLALVLWLAASQPTSHYEAQLIQRVKIKQMLLMEEYVAYSGSFIPGPAAAHARPLSSHPGALLSAARPLLDLAGGHVTSNIRAMSRATLLVPHSDVGLCAHVVHQQTNSSTFHGLAVQGQQENTFSLFSDKVGLQDGLCARPRHGFPLLGLAFT